MALHKSPKSRPTAVGGYFRSLLFILFPMNSVDLNDPPTSVGGIQNVSEDFCIDRT